VVHVALATKSDPAFRVRAAVLLHPADSRYVSCCYSPWGCLFPSASSGTKKTNRISVSQPPLFTVGAGLLCVSLPPFCVPCIVLGAVALVGPSALGSALFGILPRPSSVSSEDGVIMLYVGSALSCRDPIRMVTTILPHSHRFALGVRSVIGSSFRAVCLWIFRPTFASVRILLGAMFRCGVAGFSASSKAGATGPIAHHSLCNVACATSLTGEEAC
jgi:hypothetical protein